VSVDDGKFHRFLDGDLHVAERFCAQHREIAEHLSHGIHEVVNGGVHVTKVPASIAHSNESVESVESVESKSNVGVESFDGFGIRVSAIGGGVASTVHVRDAGAKRQRVASR